MLYLDYVATTPPNIEIIETYEKLLEKYYANADSLYSLGNKVSQMVEESRKRIANLLDVYTDELIFTSCATESNNTAIKGVALMYQKRGKHIITSKIEHSSVYNTCNELEEYLGFEVDYLGVDQNGHINLDELKSLIREDTILVSVMHTNNEVGSIQSIADIKEIIEMTNPKTKLHVDMVQSLGKIPIDLSCVDLASFSAHKIYGLKGSGLLYKKRTVRLAPLMSGGQQENGLRAGTTNAPTSIVLAKTMRLALETQQEHYEYVLMLNSYLREQLALFDEVVINSPIKECSPYILNVSCVGYKPEVIVHALEESEIYISTKSTCSSHRKDASRTLLAMQLSDDISKSALRISLSHLTTKKDIDYFIKEFRKVLQLIRK